MTTENQKVQERSSGIHAIFSLAWAYRFAQLAIGANKFRDVFVESIMRPTAQDRVLDIGCGTADIVEHLPVLDYIGFDPNHRYIEHARARFGSTARFVAAGARSYLPDKADRTIATAIGVLHHLDDENARDAFRLGAAALTPGGRFVSIDPTLVEGQRAIARFLVSQDRGQNVRTPQETAELFAPHFENVEVSVRHDLLRVPYSHVIVEATGPVRS